MQGPCSVDGNIGMPLQLSGEIQIADKEKLNDMLPNDFVFSFGSFRTKPTLFRANGAIALPSGSSQNITLRDANYVLVGASIFRPQHINFSNNQKNIIAELIFTFQNTKPSQERPYLLFLCFPLYKSVTGSSAPFLKGLLTNEPVTSQMSIQDLVTEAKTFIFYNSCVPMITKVESKIQSYSCCALIASNSLPVYEYDFKNNMTLFDYMLPNMYTMYLDTIVDFKIDNSKFTFIPSTIKRGTAGKTYRATIQTNASIFLTRFSKYTYNPDLLQKANAKACKTTSEINTTQLKCYTIKPKSDIKGGRLLVDPKTGKRMDALLAEGEPGDIKPQNSKAIAAIAGTLGALIGILILGLLIMYLHPKFLSKTPAEVGGAMSHLPELWNEAIPLALVQMPAIKDLAAQALSK